MLGKVKIYLLLRGNELKPYLDKLKLESDNNVAGNEEEEDTPEEESSGDDKVMAT